MISHRLNQEEYIMQRGALTGLLSKRNILYLNIVISVLLLLSVLLLIRDTISITVEKRRTQAMAIRPTGDSPPPEKTTQLLEYAPVLKNNPFGVSGGELKPLTGAAGQGGQQSQVTLIGTVTGPRELSYGVFRDSAGLQEVFRVGESVFGVGVLHAVKNDKVMIRKDAKVTELPLEDVKVKEIQKPASAGAGSQSLFAQKIGRGAYVVDQRKLQQAIANPAQIMTDARLRPNSAGGREEGFTLSEVKPGGIYQSLGLQDGDVLLRINEYDISNPERALQAFTALKGLDRVQIDLIRSGAKMTMTYQIQ
jgi:general secretion pathway protein C